MDSEWPQIPYGEWRETAEALHLYLQIVGKYRLAHTPWLNHSWHATSYVTARGLETSLVPDNDGIEVTLDLHDHSVVGSSAAGQVRQFSLGAMSVSQFLERFEKMIADLGGSPEFHGVPNEIENPIPFREDAAQRPYDADAVQRFHQALVKIMGVLQSFRTGFLGKSSPVHLFWGSFDLAVTRFSGRSAPPHPGGIPELPDDVTREAYSHEVSSAGFWAGGGPSDEAAFYSYAYPAPDGFSVASVEPEAAYYHSDAGEFLLPYEAVRSSEDPAATLTRFLETTFDAAARLGGWDRSLECPIGRRRIPRAL
ncbi:MAG: DUF5996 family protein [Acidobacteriota bacterium]